MKVIGIDMGGTNIRAGIINEQGKVFCKIHDYTPKSPNQILTKIHEMINHLNHYIKGSARAISLAIPGIIHPKSSEVLHAGDTVEGWKNVNVKQYLSKKHSLPIFVHNDVNMAALGISWVHRLENFVFISIGTGLGGAVVKNGSIVTGHKGYVGEFGHTILYPNGIPCGCGKKGCVEKYVSGLALNEQAKKINSNWTSYHLIEEYLLGNEQAKQRINEFTMHLSIVLVNLYLIMEPSLFVIGGGLGETYIHWREMLHNNIEKLGYRHLINIYLSEKIDDIGMIGSAKYAIDSLK